MRVWKLWKNVYRVRFSYAIENGAHAVFGYTNFYDHNKIRCLAETRQPSDVYKTTRGKKKEKRSSYQETNGDFYSLCSAAHVAVRISRSFEPNRLPFRTFSDLDAVTFYIWNTTCKYPRNNHEPSRCSCSTLLLRFPSASLFFFSRNMSRIVIAIFLSYEKLRLLRRLTFSLRSRKNSFPNG